MKNFLKYLGVSALVLLGFTACEDNDDSLKVAAGLEVQNFIWKGLNTYYLWQADVPDLADDRFNTQKELDTFLAGYAPFPLFDHLRVDASLDRFSIMVSDYTYLENLFAGVTKNNGVDYGLKYKAGSTTEIFGWVRYIIPNSDASDKNIQRGAIFYAVNGTPLTIDNYQALLAEDNYSLNLADYDGGAITPNGQSVSLTKTQLTENPVYLNEVIQQGTHKIGYLMYNAFTANFDGELNAAFGELSAAGVTDFVLDLRYNSGGSVLTASRLASMITGQFDGQLFAKEQWNAKLEAYYQEHDPGELVVNFTNSVGNGAINSLNLTKVYILTSKSTASASELVINGLKPYVNVIQIGDVTTGKNVGSVTLYDSPSFSKEGRSTKHKYAMQPIVLKIINKDGFGDYQSGLAPTVSQTENLGNLGILGDPSEPLLANAILTITNGGRSAFPQGKAFRDFKTSKELQPFATDMYLDKLPGTVK